jgi:hypothetical protein
MAESRSTRKGRPGRNPRDLQMRRARPSDRPVPGAAGDLLTDSDAEQLYTWKVPLLSWPGKTVEIRRVDMMSLFLASADRLKLLGSLERLNAIQSAIGANPSNPGISVAEQREMNAYLDRCAIEIVVAPPLYEDLDERGRPVPKPAPGYVGVSKLSTGDKMSILAASQQPPSHIAPMPVQFPDRSVREFRQQPDSARQDGDARYAGATLQPGTKLVDDQRRGPMEVAGA